MKSRIWHTFIIKSVYAFLLSAVCILVFTPASFKTHASSPVNLAYNPNYQTQTGYPQAAASYTCGCDSPWTLVNGIRSYSDNPRDRWTNYGSPNPSDWVAIDFGAATAFNRVDIYIFNDHGGVQPPASYTVQYWNGSGWLDVSQPVYSPAAPSEELNTASFDMVTSDQVRVVFTKGSAYVGVVELEVFGSSTAKTVSFDSNGGTAVSSETVGNNSMAEEPFAPTKDGYTFGGWYSDMGLTAAFDFSTAITADITLYAKWTQSSNADLSSLTLSAGVLSPAFTPTGTESYTASVDNEVDSVTVTAIVQDAAASVTINGTPVTAISPSASIGLNVGSNTIEIVVTAQDGTVNTYSITINRAASLWTFCAGEGQNCSFSGLREVRFGANGTYAYKLFANGTACDNSVFGDPVPGVVKACYYSDNLLSGLTLSLSSGELNPAFDAATSSYTVNVANSVHSITLTPTVPDDTAIVTVNGAAVPSGQASDAISLNVGSNSIEVVATVLNMTTPMTYTITVNRNAVPTITQVADQTIFANESTGALSFTVADAETAAESLTVTAESSDESVVSSAAGLDLGGSGNDRTIAITPVAGASGTSTVTITVSDGGGSSATTSFVVTVNALSHNADLSSLSVSSGSLNPAFTGGETSYTASVAYEIDFVTVTAIMQDSASTATVNGITVTTASPSSSVGLSVGSNLVEVVVTAQDMTIKTYTITVNRAALNTPPTISPIADTTINVNAITGPISFTVADNETSAGSLTVTAISSNSAVVDSGAGLALGGSGGSRTITVTPVANAAGSSIITITVYDPDNSWTSTSFMVSVVSMNAQLLSLQTAVSYPVSVSSDVYTIIVPYDVTELNMTASVSGRAALSIMGSSTGVTSSVYNTVTGSVYQAAISVTNLRFGDNSVTMKVTAQDNVTYHTYALLIKRGTGSSRLSVTELMIAIGDKQDYNHDSVFDAEDVVEMLIMVQPILIEPDPD
jgi:uncharacterized repeat protein (TIGR02543 family)